MGLKDQLKDHFKQNPQFVKSLVDAAPVIKEGAEKLLFIAEEATDNKQRLGIFLKKLREERNLSLRDVEKLTGISNPFLSQVERGIRGTPNLAMLGKLADVYGVTLPSLVEEYKGVRESEKKVEDERLARLQAGFKSLSTNDQDDFLEWLEIKSKKNQKPGHSQSTKGKKK